ncbi:MAG: PBSX family phage terminase large subunit, partial [Hungatella sp.]
KRAARDCTYTVLIRDAENEVALGISRVQKSLTFELMTISPKQGHAVDEFGTYEYDKKSIERGKEVPVKQDDHCMDAIRYLVMGFWKKYLKHYLPIKEMEEDYKNPIDEDDDDECI